MKTSANGGFCVPICNLLLVTVLYLGMHVTASAQCPTGWTAYSINLTMCTPPQNVTVHYCAQLDYYDSDGTFIDCGIEITKICPPCPGTNPDDMMDAILNEILTNNPMGLFAPPCPLPFGTEFRWMIAKPLCTTIDAQGCFAKCSDKMCRRHYSVCIDGSGNPQVTHLEDETDPGPCGAGCNVGSCP